MLNFFSSIKTYLIMGAIIAIMLVGFVFYYKYSEAQKEILVANNAKLQTAVDLQKQTIDELEKNAAKLAQDNINLSLKVSNAEQKALLDTRSLDDAFTSEDPKILEQKANEIYSNFTTSINGLTSPKLSK